MQHSGILLAVGYGKTIVESNTPIMGMLAAPLFALDCYYWLQGELYRRQMLQAPSAMDTAARRISRSTPPAKGQARERERQREGVQRAGGANRLSSGG